VTVGDALGWEELRVTAISGWLEGGSAYEASFGYDAYLPTSVALWSAQQRWLESGTQYDAQGRAQARWWQSQVSEGHDANDRASGQHVTDAEQAQVGGRRVHPSAAHRANRALATPRDRLRRLHRNAPHCKKPTARRAALSGALRNLVHDVYWAWDA
jgi:hypothetical protein